MSYIAAAAKLRSELRSTRKGFVDAVEELVDEIDLLTDRTAGLERIIHARDRFGCWMCLKHLGTENDYSESLEEKEELREENLALRLQIKNLNNPLRKYSCDDSPFSRPARSPSTVVKRVTMNAPVSPVARKLSSMRPILLNQAEPNSVARKRRQKRAAFSPNRVAFGSTVPYLRKRKVLLSHPLFADLKEAGMLELVANAIFVQLNHKDLVVEKIASQSTFIVIDGVVNIDGKTLTLGDMFNPRGLFEEAVENDQKSLTSYTVHAEIMVISPALFRKCVGNISPPMQEYLDAIPSKLDLSDLAIGRTIGRGGTAVVKLAYAKKSVGTVKTGEVFALKIIKKSLLRHHSKGDLLKNEKCMLDQLTGSDFVIKLKQTFKDAINIYILLELAPGGDLLSVISSLGILTRAQTQFYLGCVILGIAYCHAHEIIYRDLKVENFLVDGAGYVKLADFGIAKKMTSDRTFSLVGTPQFMAPEVVLGRGYSFAADLWALGCCMYEFLVGELLFDVVTQTTNEQVGNQLELFELIVKFKPETDIHFPEFVDQTSRELIVALLQPNPDDRPTIEQIKTHAFFGEPFDWNKLENKQLTPPFVPHLAPIASKRISGTNTEGTPSEVGTDDIPSASPALSSASCASFDRSSTGYRESAGSWDFNI